MFAIADINCVAYVTTIGAHFVGLSSTSTTLWLSSPSAIWWSSGTGGVGQGIRFVKKYREGGVRLFMLDHHKEDTIDQR